MMLKRKLFYNLVTVGLFAFAMGQVGCRSTSRDMQPQPRSQQGTGGENTPDAPFPHVNKIMLMVDSASAINWDQNPGPDGVRVKIYLWQNDGKKINAVTLKRGTIELLLYDGRLKIHQLPDSTPIQQWRYSADQMKQAVNKRPVGSVYGWALAFGQKLPKSDIITVSARILHPGGAPMYAQPVHLTMKPR